MRSGRFLLLLVLVIVFCALLGGQLGPALAGGSAAADDDIRASQRRITRIYGLVEANAAQPVDPDKAIYKGAIPAMLRTLDPHSNFYDPRDFRLLREEQNGHYFGVGMLVGSQDGKVIVIHPFSGSPAYRAGLRPGDAIQSVNGKNTEGLTLVEVVDMLKGPRGTRVKIAVTRDGSDQPLVFDIVRDEIVRRSVKNAFFLRPRVAYIHIETFNENTGREFEQSLRKMNERELEGLVLDLRGNPGGLLSEGVAVADRFLRKGQPIVSHRGRTSPEKFYVATRNGAARDYPIVVLVDRLSASAAEIVAGALQDHDRAWILGENTFGKGLVQSQFPMPQDTALLLTTARYYTPSGRLIQRNYENISFFDYYTRKESPARNTRDVKSTDGGRVVYGGGGIEPDEKHNSPKLNRFQRRLLSKAAFFNFTSHYFAGREARLARDWRPDQTTLDAFREFLRKREIPFTEEEIQQNLPYLKDRLLLEMYTTAFSKEDADRLAIEIDPVVAKAVESLPKAKALLEQTRKLAAQRGQR